MQKICRLIVLITWALIIFNTMLKASEFPVYDLKVTLDTEKNMLSGRASIVIPEGLKVRLRAGDLHIKDIKINGKKYKPQKDIVRTIDMSGEKKIVEIRYSLDLRANRKVSPDTQALTLLSNWYPMLNIFCRYKLSVNIPAGYEAISESDKTLVTVSGNRKRIDFNFPHPAERITLIAGRYTIYEDNHRGISIKTYLFSKMDNISKSYIKYTKKYIDMYIEMLGEYPYKSFNIVENKYQTGYSFPTYTLLGSRVIRLPFIAETSLGHEILHQWFGNYVYVDYKNGNWSEGLTTYLADHWYKYLKGEGSFYRKKILIDYDNYAKDYKKSLKDFHSSVDYASRSTGYGKSAMFFHMCRKKIGSEKFFNALKKFIRSNRYKNAGWDDLRLSFEPYMNDADEFFNNWINRNSIIKLKAENFNVVFRNGKYVLSFRVIQEGDIYKFYLPVKVYTERGVEEFFIRIDREKINFEKPFNERPAKVRIDGNYDIMRNLAVSEKPPVISSITGDKKSIVIVPDNKEKYEYAEKYFKRSGYRIKSESSAGNNDLKSNSVVILSLKNRIYRRLFADHDLPRAGLLIKVDKNPINPDKTVMLIDAKNEKELKRALRKLVRYGNYSYLLFDKGKNIKKTAAETDNGIIKDLSFNVDAVETKKNLTIDDVVEKIKNKKVVFIGEVHTEYSHHIVQYEIIKRLYEKKGNIIIGMEMFQQPFQKYLDQYIKKEIDENELIRKTEYFTRWGYDYNLYRDILHFARANKIPVFALNLRSEIIKKVSKKGIDALTPEEYAEIPQDIDMTNSEYRESMLNVLGKHSKGLKLNFDNFLQAQVLWDETMAHNSVKALKKFPKATLVVLAGNGHLQYSWGIPGRVKRLSGADCAVVLNGGDSGINKEAADFVLYPSKEKTPASPKLKVYLRSGNKGLSVTRVIKNGPAHKAGLQKGDIILSINGKEIKSITDLKLILLNHKFGDKIKLKVKRRYLLYFIKDIEIELALF